jgi:hypothetical protein
MSTEQKVLLLITGISVFQSIMTVTSNRVIDEESNNKRKNHKNK